MQMKKIPRHPGFVLIEVMVALLLIGIGLLAVSKLQSSSIAGAGQAKSRSEAAALSQQKLEQIRNMLVKATFTGTPLVSGNATVNGSNAAYAMTWTVSTPAGGLEQRLVQLTTTWTDSRGIQQRLDLNSVVSWDDPGAQGKLTAGLGGSLISPTGTAQRGSGTYTGTSVANADGTKIAVNNGTTYLLSSTNNIILYLPPINNVAQSFSTITGKIYFDQSASNGIPSSANVRVRLSSEGECIYNNAPNLMTAVTSGSNSYKYFTYTCYVGPGWYGNVGVMVDQSVNGNAASPTICIGDPSFNGGSSDGTLISSNPLESSTRTYRGFKGTVGSYLSTGMGTQSVVDQSANPVVNMPWSGTKYGASFQSNGTALTGPFDGRPRPSAYPASYTVTAGSPTDYFEQNFLVTKVSGNGTCNAKMTGGAFTRNAGKYVCINPDDDPAADKCPSIWPGFESQVGSGGTNYSVTVTLGGSGSGTVTSAPAGISCGTTCSATIAAGTSVTLTAVASNGSTFSGWSGGSCTGTGACTVPMNGATAVTANFTSGVTLSVAQGGTGSGVVTSTPAGIICGVTCAYGFSTGTSVTLAAVPNTGSTFTGWSGGGCSGTGPCTIAMNSATTVTANYSAATVNALTVTTAGTGSGTVSSSPSGISSCSSSCSASYGAGTLVTLTPTAVGGSTFTGWGGACSGTGSCSVTMSAAQSVTATFALNATCSTPISGSAVDSQGNVTASGSSNSCKMQNGNTSNYNCTLSVPQGTVVTLTNSRSAGNNNSYSYTKNVVANCVAQTGVNFP